MHFQNSDFHQFHHEKETQKMIDLNIYLDGCPFHFLGRFKNVENLVDYLDLYLDKTLEKLMYDFIKLME